MMNNGNGRMKQPVVFAFNILLNHYLAFQTTHYLAIQNMFRHYNKVEKFYLLPNITSVSMTIEQRGAQMAQKLE